MCVSPSESPGDPEEWPLWTVERAFVERSYPLPEYRAARSERRWPRSRELRFCRFLEFQAGSCLYVTVAVKAASHFGTAYVAAAAEACSRLVGVCRELRCTHSAYTLTRQVLLGLCNEVWFHRFPSPSFGFPLHPFSPSHTSFSLLFFHVFPCFMSCHLTPFFLLRTHRPWP